MVTEVVSSYPPNKWFQILCKHSLPFCTSIAIALAHLFVAVFYPMQIFHTKHPFGNKVWNIIGQTAFVTELVSHRHLLHLFPFEKMWSGIWLIYTELSPYCSKDFLLTWTRTRLTNYLNRCTSWNFTDLGLCSTLEQKTWHNTYVISFAYSLIRFSASPCG